MSILCDGQIIENIINEFGATVTVRAVTQSSLNTRGDETVTNADSTGLKAFVWVLNKEDQYVVEGDLRPGDIVFFFDNSNSAVVATGNLVSYDSQWFRIVDVDPHDVGGTKYVYEAKAKRT